MPQHADIAIIGAGAAGLAAGIFAAETNPSLRIILLDGAKTIGAKILISGGGRCNVTNQKVIASDFHGNRRAIDRILRRFNEQDTIRWFNSLGVPLQTETTGKLFPVSNKARTVLDALIDRCQKVSVTLLTQHHVQSITHLGHEFSIQHSQGLLQAKQVIVATGGRSLPKTGSDGSGWGLVQHLGHTVTPTYPALVPLLLDDSFFHAHLSGISHDVMLTTRVNNQIVDRRTGSLLWTHFGVSGPVVLDASRFWILATEQGQNVQLHLNCFPHATHKEVENWLIQAASLPGRKTVQSLLAERLPSRVATRLAQFLEPDISLTPVNLLPKDTRQHPCSHPHQSFSSRHRISRLEFCRSHRRRSPTQRNQAQLHGFSNRSWALCDWRNVGLRRAHRWIQLPMGLVDRIYCRHFRRSRIVDKKSTHTHNTMKDLN